MVEERKAVSDISALRRQKKAFGALDEREQEITNLKNQISEIKNQTDKAEYRQQQQEFDRVKKELDDLSLARKDANKDSDTAFESLKQARNEQDKVWTDLKQFKDAHYSAKRQFHEYEREANKVREAKRKAEREAYLRGRRQEALERKLEEASSPAYGDELRAAESVMRLLDPNSVPSTTTAASNEFAAKASRTVDASGIKGTPLTRKGGDEEAYFVGGGGKKGKKNKKSKDTQVEGSSASVAGGKDLIGKLWAPASIEQFSKLGVEPPSSSEDIPSVLGKVKEKRQFFLDDRDRKTKEVSPSNRALVKCCAQVTTRCLQHYQLPLQSVKSPGPLVAKNPRCSGLLTLCMMLIRFPRTLKTLKRNSMPLRQNRTVIQRMRKRMERPLNKSNKTNLVALPIPRFGAKQSIETISAQTKCSQMYSGCLVLQDRGTKASENLL